MTKLSVNINKIATLRNARGGNQPNLIEVVKDCELFGADGITVHPRPDERHIKYKDVYDIKGVISTELNIEGNPTDKFCRLVLDVKPSQVTLVPDDPNAITSNMGWDTKTNLEFLKNRVTLFKEAGIRTSIFVDANLDMVEYAQATGTDRIELYTEPYARGYSKNKSQVIADFIKAAEKAKELALGLNAGHDLSLENIQYFHKNVPNLLEVSIGHALICEAIYIGLQETITRYKQILKQ